MLNAMPQRLGVFVELPALLVRMGGDADAMLARHRLSVTDFRDPEASLPSGKLADVLETAARETGDGALGLRLGMMGASAHLGIIGLLLRHAQNLRQAILMLTQNYPRFSIGTPYLMQTADGMTVGCQPLRAGVQVGLAGVGFGYALLRELTGVEPGRITLACAKPSCDMAISPSKLAFGESRYGLEYNSAALGAAVPGADRVQLEAVLQAVRRSRVLCKPDVVGDAASKVVMLLHQNALSADKVADAMVMHRRTLNRHLSKRGTSVRELIEDVRFEVASQLMSATCLNITEIAEYLGYREPSSFTRWFRARAGMPPVKWRAGVSAALPDPMPRLYGARSSVPRRSV